MSLQGLGIGGIQGIGGFGGLKQPKPSSPVEQKTPQQQMMTPAVSNTTTDGINTDLDRKLAELDNKITTPAIDISKGFGTPKIGQSFGNITQPGIAPGIDKLAQDEKFKANIQSENKNGVTQDEINAVSDLSPYEMEAGRKAKAAGFTKEQFMESVAKKRKIAGVDMITSPDQTEYADFENLSLLGKVLYTPKNDEDKARLPRWKKIDYTKENLADAGITDKDIAASAGFVSRFPEMLSNILAYSKEYGALGAGDGLPEKMAEQYGFDAPLTEEKKQQEIEEIRQRGEDAYNEVYKAFGADRGEGGFDEEAMKFMAELIPTLMVPEDKIGKLGSQMLSKLPGVGKLGKAIATKATPYIDKNLPKLKLLLNNSIFKNMVRNSIAGGAGMESYAIISEGRDATTQELGIGAGIGAGLPIGGIILKGGKDLIKKAVGGGAARLELSGMLNPAKLNQVKEQLIEEGSEAIGKSTAEDVGTWMIERDIKGSKTEIVSKLENHAKDSKKIVDDSLASSTTLHEVDSAKKALNRILDDVDDMPGLEDKAASIREMLFKDKYTLSELNKIKRELDAAYNLYTKAGGETAGFKAEGLRNIRQNLRKYIETEAKKEGLPNIKLLNNETSTAMALAKSIARKDATDVQREMLSVFAKGTIGGSIGTQVGPFDNSTTEGKIGNFLVGALMGRYLFSTKSKTYVANSLRKLSGTEKKELSRFINSNGKAKIKKQTIEKISDISEGAKTLSTKKTVDGDTAMSNIDIDATKYWDEIDAQGGLKSLKTKGKKMTPKAQANADIANIDRVAEKYGFKPEYTQRKEPFVKRMDELGKQEELVGSKMKAKEQKTIKTNKKGLSNLGKSSIDVGITNVKGFEDQFIDKFVDDAMKFEKQGNYELAQKNYERAITRGKEILTDIFGDNIKSMDGTVGRYFGETEPTIALKLNKITDSDISKLVDVSEGPFKQKSFFTAEKIPNNVELGIIDKKSGLSNEPGIVIQTKNKLGLANMGELDNIMNQVGLPGATILPGGKGIKIYNLSAYETNYGKFTDQIEQLITKLKEDDKFGIKGTPKQETFKVRHLGIDRGEGLGTYKQWRSRGSNTIGKKTIESKKIAKKGLSSLKTTTKNVPITQLKSTVKAPKKIGLSNLKAKQPEGSIKSYKQGGNA